jgi:hypothetical protein
VPPQAFARLANEYVAKGWHYEEQASGSGHLVNPSDPAERVSADPEKE